VKSWFGDPAYHKNKHCKASLWPITKVYKLFNNLFIA